MTYKYNKEDNTISPVVEKPNPDFYGHSIIQGGKYYAALKTYSESLTTRIPVSGKHKWRDGYFITEGVHFEIQFNFSYGTKRVAVPLIIEEADKSVEGEGWKERFYKWFDNEVQMYDGFGPTETKIIQWIEDNKQIIR